LFFRIREVRARIDGFFVYFGVEQLFLFAIVSWCEAARPYREAKEELPSEVRKNRHFALSLHATPSPIPFFCFVTHPPLE
jgi:hypothetical protein